MTTTEANDTAELVDAATRQRIGKTALHETLFVEAGAGSGKTTLLVERIVNLILTTDVRLASIAAITFTEAAATELQSRVRAKFENVQATALGLHDQETVDRCRRAIADSDLAAITTLHGFANRILGEFSVAAGLPPQVRVLDEVSSQMAQEERWQRFVDRLYDNEAYVDLLQAAAALQIPLEPRYLNQSTMRKVGIEFNQNWDRLGELLVQEPAPLADFDFTVFDEAVGEVERWTHECLLPEDLLYQHVQNKLPGMRALRDIDVPLRKLRALQQAEDWTGGRGGKKGNWAGAGTVDLVKDALRAVKTAKDEALAPIYDDVLLGLSRVIASETHAAAQARRADGGLEFHDLLVLARDLLRTHDDARRALHDRYQHVLLDEFQDTDPIQVELAVLIATSAETVQGVPWDHLPVDPGRLFFVGDPKQSIYRFRRADIALFLQARDRFAGPDGAAQLKTNFRTMKPIVDWVNTMFGDQMAEEVANSQPRYEALNAHRVLDSDRAVADHRPVLLGGPHEGVKAAELRTFEAEDVVGVVQAILADPSAWPVFDREANEWRPADIEDITILLPTRTSLSFLRAALDVAEVKYRIVTGTLVYDTQEVIDALAALRAIDDPTDELSLVAALRSPLYGCSDVDLMTWRQAGGKWDIRAPQPPSISPGHHVAVAVAHLRSLWGERWFMTPSMLLERLLRERQARLLAFGDQRTVDVWRRLRFLVEQARAFEESGMGDLRGFTQWAALQGGAMARVHEPLLPETDEASLSIQTIHGAKGLEFPITILSGMTTQLNSTGRGLDVIWPASGPPSVKVRAGVAMQNHQPRADLESAMDEFEKTRLAYVAATRARDHLIVSCHHKAGKAAEKTYGGQFWRAFDVDERRDLWRQVEWRTSVANHEPQVSAPTQLGLALDDRAIWISEREALLAPQGRARVVSATRVAQTALQTIAVNETESSDDGIAPYIHEALIEQDDDQADQPVDALITRRRGRTGSAIGSAVHSVLQLVDLTAPVGVDDVVVQQCEIEAIPNRTIVVGRLVKSALDSSAVARAAQHPHFKELFVAAPIGTRTIEGYVDLLIDTPEGLVVVDYKTDTVRSEEDVEAKLAAYELQAASYAVALETVTGQAVSECRFVFCTQQGPIERQVVDLDQAKATVRSTLASFDGGS